MYKPRRTMRYYYALELIEEIEEFQCETCVFRNDDAEYPMCTQVSTGIITEEPVPALDERKDGVVVCTRYRKGEPLPPPDPQQRELF